MVYPKWISDQQCLVCLEATNHTKEWYIEYPQDQDVQHKIAKEFKAKSSVDFDVCAQEINGILSIWMNQPTLEEAKKVGVDQQSIVIGDINLA